MVIPIGRKQRKLVKVRGQAGSTLGLCSGRGQKEHFLVPTTILKALMIASKSEGPAVAGRQEHCLSLCSKTDAKKSIFLLHCLSHLADGCTQDCIEKWSGLESQKEGPPHPLFHYLLPAVFHAWLVVVAAGQQARGEGYPGIPPRPLGHLYGCMRPGSRATVLNQSLLPPFPHPVGFKRWLSNIFTLALGILTLPWTILPIWRHLDLKGILWGIQVKSTWNYPRNWEFTSWQHTETDRSLWFSKRILTISEMSLVSRKRAFVCKVNRAGSYPAPRNVMKIDILPFLFSLWTSQGNDEGWGPSWLKCCETWVAILRRRKQAK